MIGDGTAEITILERYFKDLSLHSLIDREEEVRLARKIEKGDREALKKLIESNLNFVITIAKHYQNMGVSIEDLISEGNVGLVYAAMRFDRKRGMKFITYAVWWIKRMILQALNERSRLIRLPKYKIRELREFKKRYKEAMDSLGREPYMAELEECLGLSRSEIEGLMRCDAREVSLDAEDDEDGRSLSDHVPADSESVEEKVLQWEVVEKVRYAMNALPRREKYILRNRYGFDGETRTLEDIGDEIGLTKERVRQIEVQAKQRLRRFFVDQRMHLMMA